MGLSNVEPVTGMQFELYLGRLAQEQISDVTELPWQPSQQPGLEPSLRMAEADGVLWAQVADHGLMAAEDPQSASLGFRVVHRHFSWALALLTLGNDVFVNGHPSLRLSILRVKDTILLAEPSLLLYVTQRFRPHVGLPTGEMVGKECPFCGIPVTADTPVVSCNCGKVYHNETSASHPDVPEEELLNCFGRAKKCVSCGRALTTEEYLIWDPTTGC